MRRIGKIPNDVRHKSIYRIMPYNRFLDMLTSQTLTYVLPRVWERDDPLENIVFGAELTRHGQPYEHPAQNAVYANCWTREPDSHALWRLYTGRKYGVRISTQLKRFC